MKTGLYSISRGLRLICLVTFAAIVWISPSASAQQIVIQLRTQSVRPNDSMMHAMSFNLSKLLLAANTANKNNKTINGLELPLNAYAQKQLATLWIRSPFHCDSTYIHSYVWPVRNGYMVRAIPITVSNRDSRNPRNVSLWLAVEFNHDALITDIKFASPDISEIILSNYTSASNLLQLTQIMQYVDRYLTAYYIEDINFFKQLFNDDALAIVGKEMRRHKGIFNRKTPESLEYRDSYRKEHLSYLQRTFSRSSWVHATISPIIDSDCDTLNPITQSLSNSNFYGVRLHIEWKSSCGFHDEGYSLLLWDFSDSQMPIIHVRAWQPANIFNRPLKPTELFSLSDFGF